MVVTVGGSGVDPTSIFQTKEAVGTICHAAGTAASVFGERARSEGRCEDELTRGATNKVNVI